MVYIDSHVHITDDGRWFGTSLNATVPHLLDRMDASGINKAVLLPTQGYCSNASVYKACRQHPDRFIGFGTIDLQHENVNLDSVRQAVEEYGLSGFKLHPRLQSFAPNEKRLYNVYETLSDYGVPVVFDGFLQSKTIPMASLIPMEYDILAKRFPDLVIILAHMGGHRYWDAYFAAKANANLYLDTSFVVNIFKALSHFEEDFRYIFQTLDRKIVYGSDFPECDPVCQKEIMDNLLQDVSVEKKRNIMGKNILKLVNQTH